MRLIHVALVFVLALPALGQSEEFSSQRDLLSLHYDHAPDRDDGHSVAADRMILQSIFGIEWIRKHALAVSGAYGKNRKAFNPQSDAVMDAAWAGCGEWLDAHNHRGAVVVKLVTRWTKVLEAGGDVWVKEGGQSDITAEVLKRINKASPSVDTRERVHVVQHSNWNEKHTTDEALKYTKENSNYIRIADANAYLNIKGGDKAFEKAALKHPVYGAGWKAAFDYYPPKNRLDFSDTGELLKILGLGKMSVQQIRERYLKP